jgi:hypothetical protein
VDLLHKVVNGLALLAEGACGASSSESAVSLLVTTLFEMLAQRHALGLSIHSESLVGVFCSRVLTWHFTAIDSFDISRFFGAREVKQDHVAVGKAMAKRSRDRKVTWGEMCKVRNTGML